LALRFKTLFRSNGAACRTEAEISVEDPGGTVELVALVFEDASGPRTEFFGRARDRADVPGLDSAVADAAKALERYVNRRGNNVPKGLSRAGLSLWLLEKDDGTALGQPIALGAMSSSTSLSGLRIIGKFLWAFPLAALPFVAHILPLYLGGDVLFQSLSAFLIGFAVCGAAGGTVNGFFSIPAGVVTYGLATIVLTQIGFVGGGGDGDLFYLIALFGTGVFCLLALISAIVRHVLRRSRVAA
jgi:hypothetical protein